LETSYGNKGSSKRKRRVEATNVVDVSVRKNCLDVGCGTGALTAVILQHAQPRTVNGIDSSSGFAEHAKAHITGSLVYFEVGDAQSLLVSAKDFDVAVSGLMINFAPQPSRKWLAQFARAVRSVFPPAFPDITAKGPRRLEVRGDGRPPR
jgi:ubiquinone/menaquinone biosynthesis C-methylase UbiE